jgi:YegS/Rv2252/BmrU family lipid kinase
VPNLGKAAVVLNPFAASGEAGKQWSNIDPKVREILGDYTLLRTERPWHATELVRQALRDGVELIVSVGGDGTHHEVVNGFFDGYMTINPSARMALFPMGTGSDLVRTLGMNMPEVALDVLSKGHTNRVDVGRITYSLPMTGTNVRYFLNVADFGMGGAVAERTQSTKKSLGPFATFLIALIRTLITFKTPSVRMQIDSEILEQKTLNVIIANGQYYGGGIHVAREALLTGGQFEVYVIADLSLFTALMNLRHFYSGKYVELEHLVKRFSARRIVAQSDDRVLLNLDGEQPGQLPCEIEVLPAAIQLVVPEGHPAVG